MARIASRSAPCAPTHLTLSQIPWMPCMHNQPLVYTTPNVQLVYTFSQCAQCSGGLVQEAVGPFSFKCGTSLGRWRMAATTCEGRNLPIFYFLIFTTCQFLILTHIFGQNLVNALFVRGPTCQFLCFTRPRDPGQALGPGCIPTIWFIQVTSSTEILHSHLLSPRWAQK